MSHHLKMFYSNLDWHAGQSYRFTHLKHYTIAMPGLIRLHLSAHSGGKKSLLRQKRSGVSCATLTKQIAMFQVCLCHLHQFAFHSETNQCRSAPNRGNMAAFQIENCCRCRPGMTCRMGCERSADTSLRPCSDYTTRAEPTVSTLLLLLTC